MESQRLNQRQSGSIQVLTCFTVTPSMSAQPWGCSWHSAKTSHLACPWMLSWGPSLLLTAFSALSFKPQSCPGPLNWCWIGDETFRSFLQMLVSSTPLTPPPQDLPFAAQPNDWRQGELQMCSPSTGTSSQPPEPHPHLSHVSQDHVSLCSEYHPSTSPTVTCGSRNHNWTRRSKFRLLC